MARRSLGAGHRAVQGQRYIYMRGSDEEGRRSEATEHCPVVRLATEGSLSTRRSYT